MHRQQGLMSCPANLTEPQQRQIIEALKQLEAIKSGVGLFYFVQGENTDVGRRASQLGC